jgi:hypothetical protein
MNCESRDEITVIHKNRASKYLLLLKGLRMLAIMLDQLASPLINKISPIKLNYLSFKCSFLEPET